MKHIKAIGKAWGAESKSRKANKRQRVEREFLPAALEIMDTPPRPIGRFVLWLIIGAATFALLWATFSRVDIVAVAEGRVVPRGKLQSVEAAEAGTVRALLVREGDRVQEGQPLVELDPTYADADADAARTELATAKLQRARAVAMIQYNQGQPWSIDPDGLAPGVSAAEESLVAARIRAHEAELASLNERLGGATVSKRQAQTEVARIDATLPTLRTQLAARQELADAGYAPRIQVEELQERLTTLTFQRAVQVDEILKAEGEAAMIAREASAARANFRASAAGELSEAESIIATRTELLQKAERREALQTLTAPVDGVVNEISVTTIGEVAEPGTPIITIVPQGDELIIEAFLLNKDVGFIKINQEAIIKLESYPFMRYGYLVGVVEHVSADAIVDQARGLIFPARIRIVESKLRADRLGMTGTLQNTSEIARTGDTANLLAPGMSAAVEIKTGKRTVLSYLLSPVARSVSEAGRER
ncbi:MAG: HlyD family type I secretion periplasmic adaptor subunit [Henriciella sp.]